MYPNHRGVLSFYCLCHNYRLEVIVHACTQERTQGRELCKRVNIRRQRSLELFQARPVSELLEQDMGIREQQYCSPNEGQCVGKRGLDDAPGHPLCVEREVACGQTCTDSYTDSSIYLCVYNLQEFVYGWGQPVTRGMASSSGVQKENNQKTEELGKRHLVVHMEVGMKFENLHIKC